MKAFYPLLGLALAIGGAAYWLLSSRGERPPNGSTPTQIVHDPTQRPDADDWQTVIDLSGKWEFRLDDRNRPAAYPRAVAPTGPWDSIAVPAAWEDEGYHGYDGYAWYRRSFDLDAQAAKRVRQSSVYVLLGRIDDADEVWINDLYIGRGGRMPPEYTTGSFGYRTYLVPPDVLREDRPNVITIRVYDGSLAGGILEGPVALAVPTDENPDGIPFVADLSGTWRFAFGDDAEWSLPSFDDSRWTTLRVPGTWENQGFSYIDDYAWYRTTVELTEEDIAQSLVLVLGAIDDLDQAYVNGYLIGETGNIGARSVNGDEWLQERAYPVPAETLRPGLNTVAVRVYDDFIDGGIHLGPVGLVTEAAYAERLRRSR